MPPKNKTPPKPKPSTFKVDEAPPTAVVIADEFGERFEPIVQWQPYSLLPLANVPMLHISLTRLIRDGFRNIIIFACRQAQKIKIFIDKNNYMKRFPGVKISVHNGNGCRSLGEAMRDIEYSELLRGISDFVCLPADLISDVSLFTLLNIFKERRKENSSSAIDLVFAERPNFETSDDESCSLIYTTPDMKVVQIYRNRGNMPLILSVENTLAASASNNLTAIRTNLVDTRVLLCSSHIPPLLQVRPLFTFYCISFLTCRCKHSPKS